MIRLAPQIPDHAVGLFTALSDPAIYTHLDDTPPTTIAALRDLITRRAAGCPDGSEIWLNWTIFHGDTAAGYTQATVMPHATDIAYVLGPAFWGKNTAFTACNIMMNTLRDDHAVTRFIADTETENTHSQRLLKRLGFHHSHTHGTDMHFARPAT